MSEYGSVVECWPSKVQFPVLGDWAFVSGSITSCYEEAKDFSPLPLEKRQVPLPYDIHSMSKKASVLLAAYSLSHPSFCMQ